MTQLPPDAPAREPSWNQPGGLGIKERRSWATWQLAAGIVVAAILGMVIGHSNGGSGSAGATGGGVTARTLPPEVSSSATPVSGPAGGVTTGAKPGSGAVTTTSAGTSTGVTTTAAAGATTTTAPAGNPSYLIHNLQGTGPSSLPTFTIAGGSWTIGWAYRCVLAPGGAARFQITSAGKSTVDEQGREGSGTTPGTAGGRQQLQVVTDPACAWAITVVGVSG